MWEISQWLEKVYFEEYWLIEAKESMERCTGHRNILVTEIILKTALNCIKHHTIIQSVVVLIGGSGVPVLQTGKFILLVTFLTVTGYTYRT